MNIVIVILLLTLVACGTSRKAAKGYDSSYYRTDTFSITVSRDSVGRVDSIVTQKGHARVSRSPNWKQIRGGIWYALGLALVVVVLFIKTK